MRRADRLFEIIQLLRSARGPVTAAQLAETLEVAPRTIYRDIAALQAMRVPIEGGVGVGYIMRRGYDLPPLMFTVEELEAVVVGLSVLSRTGDKGLATAAASVTRKIEAALPEDRRETLSGSGLYASSWGARPPETVDLGALRAAIRDERKLAIDYVDEQDRATRRTVQPIALIYYVEVVILAAWCELRSDFRHFRVDRIEACTETPGAFARPGEALRADWLAAGRF